MKEDFTKIVFVIDRSGSMASKINDVVGGFNSFVEKQKKEPGTATLTTVIFDDKYEILHNNVPLNEVKPITREDVAARGSTALLDAVGKTINSVGAQLRDTPEAERPAKVIFIIQTDGYENQSSEFTQPMIQEMIKHQSEKYNWHFLFFGENMDAAQVGGGIGISAANSYAYRNTKSMYNVVTSCVSDIRNSTDSANVVSSKNSKIQTAILAE